jgi:quercetin dioxygenase-like cupin family protein
MIISANNLSIEQRTGERLGTSTRLLEESRMHGKAKVFARIVLKPGSKTPVHKHEGTFEALYFLAGTGRVDDNGTVRHVKAGDVNFTDNGESHGIENIGDTDLEYIALVIYL